MCKIKVQPGEDPRLFIHRRQQAAQYLATIYSLPWIIRTTQPRLRARCIPPAPQEVAFTSKEHTNPLRMSVLRTHSNVKSSADKKHEQLARETMTTMTMVRSGRCRRASLPQAAVLGTVGLLSHYSVYHVELALEASKADRPLSQPKGRVDVFRCHDHGVLLLSRQQTDG